MGREARIHETESPGENQTPAQRIPRSRAASGRLTRAAAVLEHAGIPYAVICSHAVRAWVAQVDEAAARITLDIDILLRREDEYSARLAFESAGFVDPRVRGVDVFLDGPAAPARDAVHLVFAGEKVKPDSLLPAPSVEESLFAGGHRALHR